MAEGPLTAPRWLSDREQRAWRGYRSMSALLDLQIARDLARDSDLSESDYDVLSTLTESPLPPVQGAPAGQDAGAPAMPADATGPSWRATALADRLLWSTSRLAHHVGRMERRGLVAKGTCGDDARGATVFLTPLGRQVLEKAAPLHVKSVRRHFIDVLSPEEIDQLAAITAKVLHHLAGEGN
ncbi:MAG TPA: MarR family winged helix-turn-helix transcriptional regulator [Streptosporangiaceae bacterium]|nr:MarR family winged helix-turn-helix transcriptional regulator [Streptosporangiaceae bacterium]